METSWCIYINTFLPFFLSVFIYLPYLYLFCFVFSFTRFLWSTWTLFRNPNGYHYCRGLWLLYECDTSVWQTFKFISDIFPKSLCCTFIISIPTSHTKQNLVKNLHTFCKLFQYLNFWRRVRWWKSRQTCRWVRTRRGLTSEMWFSV